MAEPEKGAERSSIDDIIDFYSAQIDHAELKSNLKLTVEERFLKLMEKQRLAEAAANSSEVQPTIPEDSK